MHRHRDRRLFQTGHGLHQNGNTFEGLGSSAVISAQEFVTVRKAGQLGIRMVFSGRFFKNRKGLEKALFNPLINQPGSFEFPENHFGFLAGRIFFRTECKTAVCKKLAGRLFQKIKLINTSRACFQVHVPELNTEMPLFVIRFAALVKIMLFIPVPKGLFKP